MAKGKIMNSYSNTTINRVSSETSKELEDVLKVLNEVHRDISILSLIDVVYGLCNKYNNGTSEFDFLDNYSASLYYPLKSKKYIIGDAIYSQGMDIYACAVATTTKVGVDRETTAVSIFIPANWVENKEKDCRFRLIKRDLCNCMMNHLERVQTLIENGSVKEDIDSYIKISDSITDAMMECGGVEDKYGILVINKIIDAYNIAFDAYPVQAKECPLTVYDIVSSLDDVFNFRLEILKKIKSLDINDILHKVTQHDSEIIISGLRGEDLCGNRGNDFSITVPASLYMREESEMINYFIGYILDKANECVKRRQIMMADIIEKYKKPGEDCLSAIKKYYGV